MLCGAAADPSLDSVDLADPAQRLLSNRIRRLLVHLEELAPRMGQAKGQRHRSARAVRGGESVIPCVAVDLQHAMEPFEMFPDVLPTTIAGVTEHHRRLRRPLPGTVIHGVAPQPRDAGPPPGAIQHRQRRIVAKHLRCRQHGGSQKRMQRLEPPGRSLDPAHQGGTIESDAVACQHLRLSMQRQMPRELRRGDVGKQRRCRQPAFDRTRRRRRLYDCALAAPAAITGPADPLDPDHRRYHVEHLADVLANAVQRSMAARAAVDAGLDDHILAWQMLGQAADVAGRLWLGRRLLPARLHRHRLDRRGGSVLKIERQLCRIALEPLRPRAEQHPPRSLQHCPQPAVLAIELHYHLDQAVGIPWQRCGVKRHARKLSKPGPIRTAKTHSDPRRLCQKRRSRHDLGPIEAGKQQSQLRSTERHRSIPHRRPRKMSALEPLAQKY